MNKPFDRICFLASDRPEALKAQSVLVERYGDADPGQCDVIVALGGDGFMLQTLHAHMNLNVPIYGLNFGSVGFLMNEFRAEGLRERLAKAESTTIHPLLMRALTTNGDEVRSLAINEVSLLRQTRQTAKLRISVDGKVRMSELICDGLIVSTPAGSTAYNLSAYGPIIPITGELLAVTPISAFRPRRWRGALLPHQAKVRVEVIENGFRPVSAVADQFEIRSVSAVDIEEDRSISMEMLFDEGHSLEERIVAEQFS